jgi:hypothetical protein
LKASNWRTEPANLSGRTGSSFSDYPVINQPLPVENRAQRHKATYESVNQSFSTRMSFWRNTILRRKNSDRYKGCRRSIPTFLSDNPDSGRTYFAPSERQMIISDGEGTQAKVQRGYRSFLYILNALSYNRRVLGRGGKAPFEELTIGCFRVGREVSFHLGLQS